MKQTLENVPCYTETPDRNRSLLTLRRGAKEMSTKLLVSSCQHKVYGGSKTHGDISVVAVQSIGGRNTHQRTCVTANIPR